MQAGHNTVAQNFEAKISQGLNFNQILNSELNYVNKSKILWASTVFKGPNSCINQFLMA
jgi:hypothetical protein